MTDHSYSIGALFPTEATFVGGIWCSAQDGQMFEVQDPATSELLQQVPDMAAEDAFRAIDCADAALQAWRGRTAKDRATILKRWHALVVENTDLLAAILTAEQGKPLSEARAEIAYGASYIEWFAGEALRAYGEVIPTPQNDRRILTVKQSVGVVAVITPWNFPNAMITRKLAPALAAGCTVVVKPSEETPLSALALAALAEKAGLPAGVLNIVTSTKAVAVGNALTASDKVRKLSFTGSTQVGKVLMRDCADTVKKLSLELGGNAPFIVFDDADIDKAVDGAIASKFRNAGQTCVCTNRFLVQSGVHDEFVSKFKKRVADLRVGRGTEVGVTVGPLINARAKAKVSSLVHDALDAGASLESGGDVVPDGRGYFIPTVLSGVTPDMAIANEEVFGPVAPILQFHAEDEAIRIANDTPYGLAAYFYTSDIARSWRVMEALEYGMVALNEGILSTEVAPFGGIKQSGIGREGSRHGLDDYMEIKYFCVGGIGPQCSLRSII